LNIVFPTSNFCLLCWKEYNGPVERGVCPECQERLSQLTEHGTVCPRCGRFTAAKLCPNCHGLGISGLAAVLSVVPYEGQYRELIQQLKYGHGQEAAQPMGFLMAKRFQQIYPRLKPDLLIPVPLEPQRQLIRGYNQSTLLAVAISRVIRRPVAEDCLFRGREQVSQTTLSRAERLANTRGAFYCGEERKIKNKVILLIDDIITTGATLAACAQVLRGAGAQEIWGLTWAAGIRQHPAKYSV